MRRTPGQPTAGMGRRLLILGTPLAYGVVTVLHPRQFLSGLVPTG